MTRILGMLRSRVDGEAGLEGGEGGKREARTRGSDEQNAVSDIQRYAEAQSRQPCPVREGTCKASS